MTLLVTKLSIQTEWETELQNKVWNSTGHQFYTK